MPTPTSPPPAAPETRHVDGAPATLPLYLRAALPALPLVGSLPGVRHASGDVPPPLVLTRTAVGTDVDHLRAYAEVCGFRLGGTLPVTYPHMAAFGLQMSLMTDQSFPWAPMGMVHVTNTISQHRPIGTDESYDVSVHADHVRTHRAGTVVDLVSQATVDGEVVWHETSTYLSRGRRHDDPTWTSPVADVDPPAGVARWRLGADLGRRYAGVSGDRNPIHLYGLTAKAFGFPRQIVHGMWTLARTASALEGRLPDAHRFDVEFTKPILLPGTATFGAHTHADGVIDLAVHARDKVALVGRVSPLG